jgi:hypothetical protein
MALLAKIGVFVENFECYLERLKQSFFANAVENAEKKQAVLLSCLCAKCYGEKFGDTYKA